MDVPKYIHVRIGLTDAVYPVRQFITDGLMHDMYEFQVTPLPSAGRTNSGALPVLPTVRPSTLHTTILIPTGARSSKRIGTMPVTIAGLTASKSS